ncbi:MAG: YIP1 family protein, partial [Bacteroidota bacterium]|nr:YIP1 family protein [Bacteroidota bacterium]
MAEIESPEIQSTSLTTRMANVFASPSELFKEVAVNPVKTSSWLAPLVLLIVFALINVTAIFYNDAARSQIYDLQASKMQELVKEGKMTQEQADKTIEYMVENKSLGMFLAYGGISAAVMILLSFFVASLILWLVLKIGLKFPGKYKKVLEVYGLAAFVGVLGTIVSILLIYAFESLYASLSPAIFMLDSLDMNNKMHVLLLHLNVFSIWQMAIVGFGISKITNKSMGTGLAIAFGLWILWIVL